MALKGLKKVIRNFKSVKLRLKKYSSCGTVGMWSPDVCLNVFLEKGSLRTDHFSGVS